MWRKVRQLTGRQSRTSEAPAGIAAEVLNRHYANVSTDTSYQPPPSKSTCSFPSDPITEFQVFHILDRLHHTATGLDDIPSWFLKIGAPLLSLPLAKLFNLSLNSAVVPCQWKAACIAKVTHPVVCSDYRPICFLSNWFNNRSAHYLTSYYYLHAYNFPLCSSPNPGFQSSVHHSQA